MTLAKLSVTAVETFDPNTPFGCNRKFHFQYVQGIKPPPDSSLELGSAVHTSIENYLRTGVNGLHPVALSGKHLIDPYLEREIDIERWFDGTGQHGVPLLAEGIPFVGKIDLIARGGPDGHHEILDWKTSSDIARYAKTVPQLRSSTQLMTYLEWFYRQLPGFSDPLRATLVYFQTRGNRAERVTTVVDREHVAKGWDRIECTVRNILDVARERDISKVEPDLTKCDIARGCPFRSRCPKVDPFGILSAAPIGENMSLLDKYVKAAAPAPAPQPPPAEAAPPPPLPKVEPPPPRITAPEAPAPKAEAPAAKAEEPKRGPGRPRRQVLATDFKPLPNAPLVSEAPKAEVVAGTVTKVTVRHGLTVNLGNYQSARVEVELEATGMSVDDLGKRVQDELEKQAKPYLTQAEKKP